MLQVLAAGWKNPDVRTASRNIIAPVGGGLVMMLVVPILIAVGFNKVFPTSASDLTAGKEISTLSTQLPNPDTC